MEKIENSIAERLKLFVDTVYSARNYINLAEITGITSSNFSRYLNGSRLPSLENIGNFCKLGVSINWVLTEEGFMFSSDIYGYNAKEKFLTTMNEMKLNTLPKKVTTEALKNGIIEYYGTVEKFYDYLEKEDIFYDQSIFDEFFSGNETVDFHIEEILFRINFYFYLENENENKQNIEYILNNIHEFDKGQFDKQKPLLIVMSKIKKIVDEYIEGYSE